MQSKESDFLRVKEALLSQGVSFEVFDSPLPEGLQVTKLGFNLYSWSDYLNTAVERIAELGCKSLVWSDGKSRTLPVEGEKQRFKEQYYKLMHTLCSISEQYSITVCIEPLSQRRTNFLNTLGETMECFSKIGKPNLSLAIGLRNLIEMSVDFKDLMTFKESIGHIHIENPAYPMETKSPRSTDEYDYSPFFNAIREIQYSGVLSLPPDADKVSLQYCKDLLE